MSINISFAEEKNLMLPIEKIINLIDIDFKKMANESSDIEKFVEYEKNTFKIITKPKKIAMKKIFLNTNLKYRVDKKRGFLKIKSDEAIKIGDDDCNLIIDCKARVFPRNDNESTVAVKVDASLDFGFNSVINKTVKSTIEKKIKNLILSNIEKFESP